MDLPQPVEGALAQPTRAQIFTFLVELRAPAGTDRIAERFGLHPNGVRRHLERLEEGGFVTRTRVREGQGRPRDSWAVSPEANPGGHPPRAYANMTRWLVRAMPRDPGQMRQLERTGEEIGRELAPQAGGDPVEAFRDALAALGFRPTIEPRAGGGIACSLGNCPYRDSAREGPEVVCALHRGITKGILGELAPGAELVVFEPHDPERAGCRIEVSGLGPG